MRELGFECARPARLRIDAHPINDAFGFLVDKDPRQVPSQAVTRIVTSRLAEPKLLGDPVEGVPTVADPIGPGDEILAPTGFAHVVGTEAAYHIATVD
jgi:hypothetical protein